MKRKVVIIGAGHVGSHCASSLAQMGVCEEIVLVDIDQDKAIAQAMDVADSVSFSSCDVNVHAGGYEEVTNADVVVISIGEGRKPGQTRLDLLGRSVELVDVLLEQLKPYPIQGIVVTITNPVDIVADYMRKRLHLDRTQIFGTGTLLDTARLIRVLSEETKLSKSCIQAFSLGEHGDSSMIPFSAISIGGKPFSYYNISKEKVLDATRQRGMVIIEGKKSTEFGIGRALCEMVQCILRDEQKIMPASVLLTGEYGQTDVHCGVPCRIGSHGIEEVITLDLNEEEQKQLNESCDVIRRHIQMAEDSQK